MSREFLRELDLHPGVSMDEVRQAFKELAFVWHPDRQPARLQARATAKLQRINEAYEFFREHPSELLNFSPEQAVAECEHREGTRTVVQVYHVSEVRCPRCEGSGKISVGVDRSFNFLSEACPICHGHGRLLADERNNCHSCSGSGKNPEATRQAMHEYIHLQLGDTSHLTRKQVQFRHRKLWIRFVNERQVCKSCLGAGYFYYRPDLRYRDEDEVSEERRKSG